jgi:hypothetical protein
LRKLPQFPSLPVIEGENSGTQHQSLTSARSALTMASSGVQQAAGQVAIVAPKQKTVLELVHVQLIINFLNSSTCCVLMK